VLRCYACCWAALLADRLIDFIVYRLHGLTEGEVAVLEVQD